MSEYLYPDSDQFRSKDELSKLSPEIQLEVMKNWFYQNFEDPANRTPYESAEGGYIYIYGGPYDAREELGDEFSGIVPEDVIENLLGDLQGHCVDWAPTPSPNDYDGYLLDDILKISNYYHNFTDAILDIEKLLNTEIDQSVEIGFCRLLYANVITALESFLSDVFIGTIMGGRIAEEAFC